MRRILLALAVAGLVVVATAGGDAVYQSQHIALTPVAAGEVGSGFVENIHANGPTIYTHELDYTLGPVALQGVTSR
jgi:hypothetical protein